MPGRLIASQSLCPGAGGSNLGSAPSSNSAVARRSLSAMESLSSSTSWVWVSRVAAATSWRSAASRSLAARARIRSRLAAGGPAGPRDGLGLGHEVVGHRPDLVRLLAQPAGVLAHDLGVAVHGPPPQL